MEERKSIIEEVIEIAESSNIEVKHIEPLPPAPPVPTQPIIRDAIDYFRLTVVTRKRRNADIESDKEESLRSSATKDAGNESIP
jgi:hypothetical protein